MNIDEMRTWPKLDALIAGRVMGGKGLPVHGLAGFVRGLLTVGIAARLNVALCPTRLMAKLAHTTNTVIQIDRIVKNVLSRFGKSEEPGPF